MNIYKLEKPASFITGYSEYFGAVVYAVDEESARNIHPSGMKYIKTHPFFKDSEQYKKNRDKEWLSDWLLPKDIKVTLIGKAISDDVSEGVIMSDWNAG